MWSFWLVAPLALALLVADAQAGALEDAPPDPSPDLRLLPVSPPAPAAALHLLPPGVRSTEERAGLAPIREGEALGPQSGSVIERITNPTSAAGASEWFEVEYTVDPTLDERVRDLLSEGRVPLGHVILLDPATGEIFSYVSTDPETFPATRVYPTASLMKVVTAAAVLRNAPESASRDCHYSGSPYRLARSSLKPRAGGDRVDSFQRAIAISNNQCFGRLAVHDVGEEALLAEMHRLGLLEPPAPVHPAGQVDPIADSLDLGHLGSGLAGSFITPLAAARLAAVLAQGQLVRPYWIARVRDAEGNLLALPGREAPRRVWPPELADELRELMVAVTARGTAKSAFRNDRGKPLLGPIRVAGKTGSLSGTNPDGRYEWFIGVAPAEAPRIAIAVVVVNGPLWWSNASGIAAATLHSVFCDGGSCDASAIDPLHARASSRRAEIEQEQQALLQVAMERAAAERERRISKHDSPDLDQAPRPIGATELDFPRRLLRRKARGTIVLLVELNPEGEVLGAQVDSSDLPRFDDFVLGEIKSWKFTPPTKRGRPVHAKARLPISIDIE